MPIYSYKKVADVGSDYYPLNTHLCVEYSSSVYFVPFQKTSTIYKLNTTSGAVSLIVTEPGAISMFFLDNDNDRLYYYYNQANFSYVDLTDDSITDITPTLSACEDIFVYSGDLWAVDTSQDDLTYYKYNSGGPTWDASGTIAEGATNFYDISGDFAGSPFHIEWDGTFFYVNELGVSTTYKYDTSFTLQATIDIGALGGNDLAVGICWDGTNFFIGDQVDVYIYKYNAALDTLLDSFDIGAITSGFATGEMQDVIWDGTNFFVLNGNDALVYKYNAALDTLVTTYDIGALGGNDYPVGLVWDGTYFYVSDWIDASIYKYDSAFSVILAIYDIGALGGNDNVVGLVWDGTYFYTTDPTDDYIYVYNSDFKTDLGMITHANIIGVNAYLVYQYINNAAKIYVKDLSGAGNPTLSETITSGYVIPFLENQRGISYDGSNILYFVLKKIADLKTYLCSYAITADAFTVNTEFNVALMLNRNTNTSNNPPFNLEKGFGVETGVNDQMIYQIPSTNLGRLWKIADLTNDSDIGSGVIVAITDTYLLVLDGANVYLYKFQSADSFITLQDIIHNKQDVPTMNLEVNSDVLTVTKDLFIQVIDTYSANGASTANTVIFEGRAGRPSRTRYQLVKFINPAIEIDQIEPRSGEFSTYSGRTDEIISAIITDYASYITVGTMSAGIAKGTITFDGSKTLRRILDEFAKDDEFTWYFKPDGSLYYDAGTVDTGVDISTDNMGNKKPQNVNAFDNNTINAVIVKGAFIDGVQIISNEQTDAPDILLNGKSRIIVTDALINTIALANSKATAILTQKGSGYTTVQLDFRDITAGFLQAGQQVTLKIDTTDVNITSAQYTMDKILYNGKTKQLTIELSSGLVFAILSNESSLQEENSQQITQVAGTVTTIAGGATDALVDDTAYDATMNGDITHAPSRNVVYDKIESLAVGDISANNWKLFYSNGSGVITELSLGAADTILESQGSAAIPQFVDRGEKIVFGTYAGTGLAQTITDPLGGRPVKWFMTTRTDTGAETWLRTSNMASWFSKRIEDAVGIVDRINFSGNNVLLNRLGTTDDANFNGIVYDYIAIG